LCHCMQLGERTQGCSQTAAATEACTCAVNADQAMLLMCCLQPVSVSQPGTCCGQVQRVHVSFDANNQYKRCSCIPSQQQCMLPGKSLCSRCLGYMAHAFETHSTTLLLAP
jgi:hypothetical protein